MASLPLVYVHQSQTAFILLPESLYIHRRAHTNFTSPSRSAIPHSQVLHTRSTLHNTQTHKPRRMSLAFLLHALPSPFPRPTTTPCTTTTAARSRPRVMACMSPHVPSPARIDFGNEPPAREIPHVPEIAAVSPTICEFMNTERLRDLAQYIVNFGTKFVRVVKTQCVAFSS